jgi:hypothetical protein
MWFSLGHSSVVVIMCIVIALGSQYMREHLQDAQDVGAIVGTAVSATVLFIIGSVNMWAAYRLSLRWKKLGAFERAKRRVLQQRRAGGPEGAAEFSAAELQAAHEWEHGAGLEHEHGPAAGQNAALLAAVAAAGGGGGGGVGGHGLGEEHDESDGHTHIVQVRDPSHSLHHTHTSCM